MTNYQGNELTRFLMGTILLVTYLKCSLYISHTRSVKYQPIFHTLYFMLHCTCILNNIVLTPIIEMIVLDGRVCTAFS